MAFEARRPPLAQFGRDAGRHPVEYPPPVDGSRVLSHAEAYYPTPPPAGFSCEPAPPESSYQWNLQARVLYDEMMKVSERKLNVNTRPRGFNYHRMDDLLEDELAASDVQSPRHYEDSSCYSPRTAGRMGSIPIHQRGSSPTSVLDGSGDAWNLLYETTGRLHHMDLNNELHSHLLDRSSYLVSRQMGSPRSSPLSNPPFGPSGVNSSYHGVNVGYHYDNGLPNLCGMNPEIQSWSNGYGMVAAPIHPGRQAGRKLGHGLVPDRGFQMSTLHSNPRAPMRAVFVTERSGHPRESTGTGVFLPRCVGGGPDFNRKPTCAPVLLPMWGECSSPHKSLETPMAAAAHRQPLVPPPVQVLERHGVSAPNSGDMENLNPSLKAACKQPLKSLQYDGSAAEVRELDDVELPPEWVY